jgi:hypothetical protein
MFLKPPAMQVVTESFQQGIKKPPKLLRCGALLDHHISNLGGILL